MTWPFHSSGYCSLLCPLVLLRQLLPWGLGLRETLLKLLCKSLLKAHLWPNAYSDITEQYKPMRRPNLIVLVRCLCELFPYSEQKTSLEQVQIHI